MACSREERPLIDALIGDPYILVRCVERGVDGDPEAWRFAVHGGNGIVTADIADILEEIAAGMAAEEEDS